MTSKGKTSTTTQPFILRFYRYTPFNFHSPSPCSLLPVTPSELSLIYLYYTQLHQGSITTFWALLIPGRKGPPAACRISNPFFDRAVILARWLQHQPWVTLRTFRLSQNTNSFPFPPYFHPFPTSSSLSYYPSSPTGPSPCSSIGSTPKIIFHNTDYIHPPKS